VTALQFENRMTRFLEDSFLPQHMEIHWFSIINSSILVLLLLGILVTIFMRVLKHDFAKFSRDDELGEDAEETGELSLSVRHSVEAHGNRCILGPQVIFARSMLPSRTAKRSMDGLPNHSIHLASCGDSELSLGFKSRSLTRGCFLSRYPRS
jgi:hypothetical protein